ncbi:MAG: hypothetical protein LBC92_05845 [Rickettsiales bacterium]|jgi:hypothetical protein|nr:hypothetical protein [Rickettsiales bacterium]
MTDIREFNFDKEIKKGSIDIPTSIIPNHTIIEIFNCDQNVITSFPYKTFQYQYPKKFLNEFLKFPFSKHKLKFHNVDFIISISSEQNYYDYNTNKTINKYDEIVKTIKNNIKELNITTFTEDDIKEMINNSLKEKDNEIAELKKQLESNVDEVKDEEVKEETHSTVKNNKKSTNNKSKEF